MGKEPKEELVRVLKEMGIDYEEKKANINLSVETRNDVRVYYREDSIRIQMKENLEDRAGSIDKNLYYTKDSLEIEPGVINPTPFVYTDNIEAFITALYGVKTKSRIVRVNEEKKYDRIYDIINYYLNKQYTGWQKATCPVVSNYIRLWFPKLAVIKDGKATSQSNTKDWVNIISDDGNTIISYSNEYEFKSRGEGLSVTFAKENGYYRFVGVFKTNLDKSKPNHRVNEKVFDEFDFDRKYSYIDYNELNYDDLRAIYKEYMSETKLADATISTAYSDTFYIWNKEGKDAFWSIVLDPEFEVKVSGELERVLKRHSSGDVASLVSGYATNLRRFRKFIQDNNRHTIETPNKTIDPNKKGKEMNETNIGLNTILYGPPGTGKTYNTANYAVAICDGRDTRELTDYDAVMKRYNELKEEGRIAFTTFHQSYGYEEFIEGIKPNVIDEESTVAYSIEPGVFKRFCSNAKKKTVTNDDRLPDMSNARVWCITLGGRISEIRDRCYKEGTIRIGWSGLPEKLEPDYENLSAASKSMVLGFQDEMEIGDLVIIEISNRSINGIGVIVGDYEYDKGDLYPRRRDVKWLMTDKEIDVSHLNGGKKLAKLSVYRMSRVTPEEVLSLIDKETGFTVETENRPYVFVIDEINRGNISKIFGELITLIEDTKREGMPEEASAILPYSGDRFSVPSNVYILGTMNTADRSIALMDTALRRRFGFEEMMPKAQVLREIGADKVGDLDVAAMLETINKRIEFLYDREHTIGHAFFTGLMNDPSIENLANIFKRSIIPLLQEYFYEDYQKIQFVLGDNAKKEERYKFIKNTTVKIGELFKGNTEDLIDLPDQKYEINYDAFMELQSYKEIM